MSTLASASAPMPAPTPAADVRELVATGIIAGAARLPGRLETSVTAAAGSAVRRAKKRGIAWLARTANACVDVPRTDVRRHRSRRVPLRVQVIVMIVQRLERPTSRQRAVWRRQVRTPAFVAHVVRRATHPRTRRVTLHVSGLTRGLGGGVMTGVPSACAASTAGEVAAPATPGPGQATAMSASADATAVTRRRRWLVTWVVGIVCGTRPSAAACGADNTLVLHG